MLGLAALAWDVELPVAISRLKRAGLSNKDIHAGAQRDKLASAFAASTGFWNKIRKRHPSDQPGSQDLIDRLGWNCRVPIEHREETVGRLYGVGTRSEVENFLPYSDFSPGNITPFSSGWKEVVVVPFTDLPGRLCGLLSIGRNADPDKDYAFKPLLPTYEVKQKFQPWVEGGVSMHPLAIRASRRWSDRTIAIRDIELGLRLQCSNLERNSYPLPIVLWYSKRQQYKQYKVETRNSWVQLYGKDLVFWMPKPCGTTMAQAITQNASVSLMRPPEGIDPDSYYRYRAPDDIIASIFQSCQPWKEAFPKIVASLSDKELEEFLIDLEEFGVSVKELDLPTSTLTIINNIVGGDDKVKMITLQGSVITEQGGAWYRHRAKARPELLVNAAIEITHVIHQPTEDKVIYKGHVNYNKEKIPFSASGRKFEKKALSFARALLLENRKGLITFPDVIDRFSTHIALQFSKPEFVTGLDRVGWSVVDNALVLPAFSIPMGGDPKPHDQNLFLEGSPCWDLQVPNGLSAADIELIQAADKHNTGLIWDILAAITTNLVSPGVAGSEAGQCIGLHGLGATQTAKALIAAFGGNCIKVGYGLTGVQRSIKISARHDFPTYVDIQAPERPSTDERYMYKRWTCFKPVNAFAPLTRWQFLNKVLDDSWIGIECFQPVWITPEVTEACKNFLSYYLASLIKRHIDIPAEPSLTAAIRRDMELVIRKEVKISVCKRSHCYTATDAEGKAEAFIELLSKFVTEGKLIWEPSPDRKPEKAMWTLNGELFLPKKLLSRLMLHACLVRPDKESISILLTRVGKLIGETEDYWIIDSAWWEEEFKRRNALEKKMLKLIS